MKQADFDAAHFMQHHIKPSLFSVFGILGLMKDVKTPRPVAPEGKVDPSGSVVSH